MTTEIILKKLDEIKLELDFIKEHMVDVDTILTDEDREALEKAEREFREGKAISHEKLKKELGL